ncbi:MAG: ATP-binding cassette domain-containing protein [Bacteroidota bacterium]
MLTLRHVSKAFGSTHALRDVSLTAASGQTTALLGPSGCGKSTLLRLMIGLLRPDSGTVQFEGEAVTPQSAERLRRRMGYVIQDGGLFPHLTARENVTLMARHLGQPSEQIERRLRDLASLVKLPLGALDRYPVQLSGGQRQRVGLVRALFLDPDVLLLDEPLGALDPLIRADLQDDLRAIFRDLGKTVVLVTHDVGEAAYLGDTLVLLRDGEVVQTGSLKDLAERPARPFVERFLRAQRNPAFDRA